MLRNRAESSTVPVPKTRFLGKPESFKVTSVIMSTGLAAMTKIAFGAYLTTSGIMLLKIPTFFSSRSRRVSPGFWLAPAVMTIMPASFKSL